MVECEKELTAARAENNEKRNKIILFILCSLGILIFYLLFGILQGRFHGPPGRYGPFGLLSIFVRILEALPVVREAVEKEDITKDGYGEGYPDGPDYWKYMITLVWITTTMNSIISKIILACLGSLGFDLINSAARN